MRPVISCLEARYILELLERETPEIQAVCDRYWTVQEEIRQLNRETMKRYVVEGVVETEENRELPEKKAELARLGKIYSDLAWHLETHNALICKYRTMAEGTKHTGRYPSKCIPNQYPLEPLPNLKQYLAVVKP